MTNTDNYLKNSQQLIISSLLCLGCLPSHASEAKMWSFRVSLDDKYIGYHVFNMTARDGYRWVTSEAYFKVKILFITAYEYEHSAEEIWNGNCLESISSDTNDNGDPMFFNAAVFNNQFILNKQNGKQTLDGCVRSFAYWDINLLETTHLLNSQNGEYMPIDIVDRGLSVIELDGETIQANKYSLTTDDGEIYLWYSDTGQWLSLQTETDNGYTLTYRLTNDMTH